MRDLSVWQWQRLLVCSSHTLSVLWAHSVRNTMDLEICGLGNILHFKISHREDWHVEQKEPVCLSDAWPRKELGCTKGRQALMAEDKQPRPSHQ